MSNLRAAFELLREAFQEWNNDRAPRLAAALSYYTIFSIAPFLVIVIAVAGLAFGPDAVQGRLDEQIQGLVGREGADTIQEFMQNVRRPSDNIIATVIGLATLILGAAGLFGQLQDALNTVWGVTPKPGRGILDIVRERFLSFAMVLGVGFLLLVSLVLSAALSALHSYALGLLPGAEVLLRIVNFVVSFAVITSLFALIFKLLPDVVIRWRDVWVGAAVTALLFTIGKTLLGLYLGSSGILTTYGAAGSLIIILLWVFYSAQILLYGAEFTRVYARRYGGRILPAANAVAVTAERRAVEGMEPVEKPLTPTPPAPPAPAPAPPAPPRRRWLNAPLALGAALVGLLVGLFVQRGADDKPGP